VALEADLFTPATPATLQIYGKGGAWRTVPLPSRLEQLIASYRERLGTGAPAPLLLSPTGRRLAVRDIERLLERAVQRTRTADPAHERLRKWTMDGTWERLLAHVVAADDAAGDVEWVISVDSPVVRAHQHADGARKRGLHRRGGSPRS